MNTYLPVVCIDHLLVYAFEEVFLWVFPICSGSGSSGGSGGSGSVGMVS